MSKYSYSTPFHFTFFFFQSKKKMAQYFLSSQQKIATPIREKMSSKENQGALFTFKDTPESSIIAYVKLKRSVKTTSASYKTFLTFMIFSWVVFNTMDSSNPIQLQQYLYKPLIMGLRTMQGPKQARILDQVQGFGDLDSI